MMRQSPNARRLYKSIFKIDLKSSGHVRWFADWELIIDISEIGIDRILNEFVKKANDNQWAKRSTGKFLNYFGNNIDSSLGDERLARVLVSSAVIANVGKIFCKSCYILEGDSNLVFRASVILSNVELFVGDSVDEFTLPFDHKLDNNIEKAVHILSKYKECFVVVITEAKKIFEEKQKELIKLQQLIEELKLQKEILEDGENINNKNGPITNDNIEINIGQRRSGRSNVNLDYRSMSGIRSRNNNTNDNNNNNNNNNNTNPLDHIQQELNSIKSEWVDLKALRDDAQKQVTAKERDLISYATGRVTEETEFRSFALDIAKPAINYFLKQMNSDYLKILRDGLRAVQCFDTLFINNNDQVTLQVLVRDLVHLGLYNIYNECINGMISELQKLKDEAKDCKN